MDLYVACGRQKDPSFLDSEYDMHKADAACKKGTGFAGAAFFTEKAAFAEYWQFQRIKAYRKVQ